MNFEHPEEGPPIGPEALGDLLRSIGLSEEAQVHIIAKFPEQVLPVLLAYLVQRAGGIVSIPMSAIDHCCVGMSATILKRSPESPVEVLVIAKLEQKPEAPQADDSERPPERN